jgi:TonB family protein
MIEPRLPNLRVFAGFLAVLFCTAAIVEAHIPQKTSTPATPADETIRAINLYQQGQNEEAIRSLRGAVKRNKNDLRAWHYLGLALEKKADTNGARKAHEKAAKLGEKLLTSQLGQVQHDDDFARLLLPFKTQFIEAGESAQKYLALSSKPSKSKNEEWSLRSDSLLGFADIADAKPDVKTLFKPKEVDVKARVISKPEPAYTEEARKNQVTGTVVLNVIFAATGKVIGIRVVSGLPDGLTASSINSARRIKFIPAMKDGKPVSMYAQLEYTFSIY